MDPSEIIDIPYPLESLAQFAGGTTWILFLLSVEWWEPLTVLLEIRDLAILSVGTIILFWLCGVPYSQDQIHTLWVAVYTTALLWLSPPSSSSSQSSLQQQQQQQQQQRQNKRKGSSRAESSLADSVLKRLQWRDAETPEDILASTRLYGTVLVAIPFQVLHILDWGAQVQRYPLPILLGTTIGWSAATVFAVLWILVGGHEWLFPSNRLSFKD